MDLPNKIFNKLECNAVLGVISKLACIDFFAANFGSFFYSDLMHVCNAVNTLFL